MLPLQHSSNTLAEVNHYHILSQTHTLNIATLIMLSELQWEGHIVHHQTPVTNLLL